MPASSTSMMYGSLPMSELRKITVQVPERDLEMAQELTGQGVTETVRAGPAEARTDAGAAAAAEAPRHVQVHHRPRRTSRRPELVAVDTSTLDRLSSKARRRRRRSVSTEASPSGDMALPPVVLTEILSEPELAAEHRSIVLRLPTIEITEGYWIRAAATRATASDAPRLTRKTARCADRAILHRPRLCALITRDRDFRHFAKHCGLSSA